MLVKTLEIARIADKYSVIICKEILELGGGSTLNPAKEDMRITRINGYPVDSGQLFCHPLALCHKGWEVKGIVISMSEKIMGSFYCELVYRPRHSAFPDARKERGWACDIADTKSRNGKLLCHRVKENDIWKLILASNQRLFRERSITLINNENDIRMRDYCRFEDRLRNDLPSRVVRVAEPE